MRRGNGLSWLSPGIMVLLFSLIFSFLQVAHQAFPRCNSQAMNRRSEVLAFDTNTKPYNAKTDDSTVLKKDMRGRTMYHHAKGTITCRSF